MKYVFISNRIMASIEGRKFLGGIYQTDEEKDAQELRESPHFGKMFHESIVSPPPEIEAAISSPIPTFSTPEQANDTGNPRRGRKPPRPASH